MDQADQDRRVHVLTLVDPDGTVHHDRWLTDAALNKTYADERVGMLDYWEIGGRDMRHFRWITDLELTAGTVSDITRAGGRGGGSRTRRSTPSRTGTMHLNTISATARITWRRSLPC
ncbi:hypothetical protein [Fimbriiglobus ruber]|uniref:Uncharacterized protein n=1 Tax=Fimbriiglobus ruber TaxID=1908690 RepID=A0A225D808_9BACT|nr:hypothetical protein [Fimbriiglobus ruber]OWK37730.1 hypothetical protein FRUB_06850 [Fimbriiglobus ruber]